MPNPYYTHSSGVPVLLTRGVSSLLRSELDLIATAFTNVTASPALTGTPTAPTAAPGVSTTQLATTAFAAALAFNAALPAQTGSAGKFVTTNGLVASWAFPGLTRVEVSGTTATATAGNDYWATNGAATLLTAPAAADGDEFAFTPVNGLFTNAIDFGAATVRGPAGTASGVITLTLGARMHVKYSSTLSQWVML